MNITFTNSTLNLLDGQLFYIGSVLFACIQVINFSLGIPLGVYLMIFLSRTPGIERTFVLSHCLSEILYAISAPLHILCQVDVNLCYFRPLGFFLGIFLSARPLFQCLVCLERYLAVVHPVIFLKFKPLRYRLGCVIMVWTYVLFCSFTALLTFPDMSFTVFEIVYISILVVDLFCCLSILRVLRRPGPGDKKLQRDKSRNAKNKAFKIICISLLTFVIQTIPIVVVFTLKEMFLLSGAFKFATAIAVTINICASFMQALFYLNKAGKLPFPKCI